MNITGRFRRSIVRPPKIKLQLLPLALMTALAITVTASADELLHHPESIVFDSARNRYLIANFDDGNIIAHDSNGVQTIFASPGGNSLGMAIVGDTIYVAQTQRVIGFELTTALQVVDIPVISYPYLEGMTTDGSEYLYVVHHTGFIIRVRISDQTVEYYVTGLPYWLQDCVYDGANNRLLTVGYQAASGIGAVDLNTLDFAIVVATPFGAFDGITMDNEGYIYVASHNNGGCIYRFDPDFSEPPFLFTEDGGQPTNLQYNLRDSILAVPWIAGNTVSFHPDIYKIDSDSDGIVDADDNCPETSNPAQEDRDFDAIGDSCDFCADDPLNDVDADSICGNVDNCPGTPNTGQSDQDGDGIGDACCCGFFSEGRTGNANCSDDGKLTLSDVARLIDEVFISKLPLCCPANGNTNGSLDCKHTLSDITILIDAVFISKTPPEDCISWCGEA